MLRWQRNIAHHPTRGRTGANAPSRRACACVGPELVERRVAGQKPPTDIPLEGFDVTDQDDRAARRAEDRERRAQERVAAAVARTEHRAVERDAAGRRREEAREARRHEEEQRRTALATERDARPRRRASTGALSRTGEKPVERDTRNYATDKDPARIRTLAARGAKPAALAAVFGISVAEVEAVLAAD